MNQPCSTNRDGIMVPLGVSRAKAGPGKERWCTRAIMTCHHLEHSGAIERLRDENLRILIAPMPGMWERAVIAQATFWELRDHELHAGHFCLGSELYPGESQGMLVAGWPPLWYTPFVLGGIEGSLGTMQMQGRSDGTNISSCTHLVRGAGPL
jgi:hypothetical protein